MRITVETINEYLSNDEHMVESGEDVKRKYDELGIDAEELIPLLKPFFGDVATGCFLAGLALGLEMSKSEHETKASMEDELQKLIEETENGS